VIKVFAAPPTGRENLVGMLSQDGASLCPGLFSFLPSGKTASFYTAALAPLGINRLFDYDGSKGPPGHPDLKGFGANGRIFFWLREGLAEQPRCGKTFVAVVKARIRIRTPHAVTS
jgi:hypothetical protein